VPGFVIVAVLALVAVVIAYRVGQAHGRRASPPVAQPVAAGESEPQRRLPASASIAGERGAADAWPAEERVSPQSSPALPQLLAFADDRRRLLSDLADARAQIARYRQIVVDIEHNAPPPLLDAPGTPDDLKMIVGVGPVIERMLYQLGVGTYRQIAKWNERDIDEFDARLREFPGRIRRDGWVTQARALHASKYGSPP
jgi:predicted flap endonuclease-1-like 5' DNA nuclease